MKERPVAQYSYTGSDAFKAYVNFVSGDNIDTSKSTQFDLVLTSKITGKFSLGYNGTVNRTKLYLGNKVFDENKTWWGSALYVNYDVSKTFGLTVREEYFSDENQLKMYSAMPGGGSIFASTLSANIHADNLILIPEFRFDQGSSTLFTDKKSSSVKWAANFLIAAVYQF